ncbi:uncharacterized protein LOC129608857 [Condylostylus longicornis]|uniref:uncharacterized protein LOC129608857 n=1 Tax=Condylostylus longicornis TaxID=2530218 RepID=UPI00244DED08|nr:uncharacterized protein LOC129608857 [Condylostylus longicornis]
MANLGVKLHCIDDIVDESVVDVDIKHTHQIDKIGGFGPEFGLVQKLYEDCQDTNDFIYCLKEKALNALSKAANQNNIKIADGLILEKSNLMNNKSILNELQMDARSMNEISDLDRKLLEKIDKFFGSHILKFDLSETKESNEVSSRDRKHHKKKDHGIKYVVAALLTAMGIAGPIGLKALAAVAIKALVISKVALTIASIIALKKLFAHEHHEETSFQVHAGDHNRRSTFVVRPVKPSAAATLDPYKYYYEYPASSH